MDDDIRAAMAAWLQARYGATTGYPGEVDGVYLRDAADLLGLLGDTFPAVGQALDAHHVRRAVQGQWPVAPLWVVPEAAPSPAVVGTELDPLHTTPEGA